MEKSFNDQELADIMSEIENLEREFASDKTVEVADEAPAPVAEAAPVEEHHEVIAELAAVPTEKAIPKTNYEDTVVPFRTPAAAPAFAPAAQTGATAPATMSFQVQGDMAVNLSFTVEGQTVSLNVTSEGLCIETAGGAKFILPIHSQAKRQAA
jgi:hypothetical protein